MAIATIDGGLGASETHKTALASGNQLHVHSEGKGWRNVYASLATESPWAGSLSAVPHTCIIYCLHQGATVQRMMDGDETQVAKFSARTMAIIPGGIPSHWEINGRPDVLLLYLEKSMMDDLAVQAFGETTKHASIIPRMAFNDPVLEQLALAVLEELRREPRASRFYVEHIATAIAARLVSHHMRCSPAEATKFDGTNLSGRLQRVRSFIEIALGGPLTVAQLAEEAHLSQDHLIRTFREHLGMTPHQYIMKRRIEKAKELLISTNMPIADLSVAIGFSDQSHLSTAFRKAVGVSPARYRKSGK